MDKKFINIETVINATAEKVWIFFTEPKHICNWCFATDDWHVPLAENDLKVNGKFKTRMAAKDGSFEFDFEGIYTGIEKESKIEYRMSDGREVNINFQNEGTNQIKINESFEPEDSNSIEMQRDGWQAILNNFKKYVESN